MDTLNIGLGLSAFAMHAPLAEDLGDHLKLKMALWKIHGANFIQIMYLEICLVTI